MYALRHPKIFSSAMPAGLIGNKRPLIPLHVDPPEQVKYRKFLDPLFSYRNMLEMESDVRTLAAELIGRFANDGACEFNAAFAIPFPCTVFLRLMGLPQADLDLFLEVKDGIIRPEAENLEAGGRLRTESGERIYAYFEEVLEERRKSPGDDLLSRFVEAEVGGQRMTTEDLLDICFLFLIAGLDTVTATLGCSVSYLAQHPDRRRALVENPSLIPSAVEELLRWETPVVQIVRILTQDITMGGVEMKQGEAVTLVLGAANTDDENFFDADKVSFDRSPNKHLAFGGGVHRCLGSHLARMELRVALEELHRAVPVYSLEPGETPVYTPAIREVSYLPLVFQEAAP
jgi:cytochrome P450